MAFSSFGSSGTGNVSEGPALPEVQTEGLGFLNLAGEAKLRLSTQWSPPPSPNASLMSIASRRGLVAAAGPDAVVISSTDAIRKAFEGPKDGDSDVRPFTPQLKLPLPIRISQLAFTADEAYLILSAEQGGGLAVYDVNALQQGSTQTAFELSTDGEPLRALVPNPRPEKAELCAVATTNGKLLIANLKERSFTHKNNNQVLKEQVSCIAWSKLGKQLAAGLGDGTICQLTPEGDVKAEIPRPPQLGLGSSDYVSTLVWLENDLFLAIHVSTANGPQARCHLITRQGQKFQYQRLNDPVEPYTADKVPHHTALRLKDFPPDLQDLLIFCSSAVPDIGLIARAKSPLSANAPINVFTNIELADDSRRATLPMGQDLETLETPAAIGVSLDLSSKDKVYKPIPRDELDESPGPLPGYWVLNEQGILSIWWVVYSDSVRGGTTYPGLGAVENGNVESASMPARQAAQPTPFGAPSPSPFGTASTTPAFGSTTMLGAKTSPWGTASTSASSTGATAFGAPSFGTSNTAERPKPTFGMSSFGTSNNTATASAFGRPSAMGTSASPWASGGTSTTTPAFGQVGFTNASSETPKPFGSTSMSNTPSGTGFSSFAGQGGFAALKSNISSDKPSIFASANAMDTDTSTSFPSTGSNPLTSTANPFGSQAFKLTSGFKPDTNTQQDSNVESSDKEEKSLFGANFTSSMEQATTATRSVFGDSQSLPRKPPSRSNTKSTTPPTSPSAPNLFTRTSPKPTSGGLFSFPPASFSGSIFGKTTSAAPPPTQKSAPDEAPLPPESTNITDVKDQSGIEDLPLPPDSPALSIESKEAAPLTNPNAALLSPDPAKNKSADQNPPPALPKESTTSKPKSVFDDAFLPPDPVKNKKAYAKGPPALPGTFVGAKASNDGPLPSVLAKESKAYKKEPPAMPIAKQPSAIAGPGFKFPTELPPVSDSDDDDLADEATDAASEEGSGVDVTKELSPSSAGANRTPGFTPQGSFDGLGGSYSTISRPDSERRSFFLGHNAPVFPQPNPISPRSPSPVRNALPPRMIGNDHTRSFSAPGMASQLLVASRKQTHSYLNSSSTRGVAALENTVMEQQRKARAKKEADEAQVLVEEDDGVQQLLKADIEPTLDLDEFIAHAGVEPPAGDSVPAQVEAVYRDINAMIDTLGLNYRSLKAWTTGHKELGLDKPSQQDLASSDGWALGDIEQLTHIVDQVLRSALDEAKVVDVEDKVAQAQDIHRELTRDCNKQADIRKLIASRLDPEQAAAYRALPLSAEQAAQQSDLRRHLARFQTLLARTEEDLTLLKAKIVSVNSASGKGGPVPTIEAIVRTITKMTSMVEKRSGDIDVLENQMRKLRLGSTGPSGSREGSPFATPNAKRMLGSSIFSPDRSTRETTPMRGSLMRHSLSGSVSGLSGDMFQTPPRKKLSGYADTEKKALKQKREKRAAVLGKLRNSIQARGPTVITLGNGV